MAPSGLARLLLCLSAAGSAAAGAPGFLAKADGQLWLSEGQQCGGSYGDCGRDLQCVPPADDAEPGAPGVCRMLCGTFGAGGERVDGACGANQTCSGRAATPCNETAGGCYMYCDSEAGGASTAGRRLKLGVWQQCGQAHYDGDHWYGECDSDLVCVAPAEGATDDTPSICHQRCGTFDKDGANRNHSITCLPGESCSGRAATPCGGGPAQAGKWWHECPAGETAEFSMFCWG